MAIGGPSLVRIQCVEARLPNKSILSRLLQAENIRVVLVSLAYADMATKHEDRKVKHESHGDVIDMIMSTFEKLACRIDNVAVY